MKNRSKWCLVGIPDHQGVANVGGRLGAALGPQAFRASFARLTGRDGVKESWALDVDAAPIAADVTQNHERAAEVVRQAHAAHAFSVVVGGGHDHGYSHLLGIHQASQKPTKLGCINIDAHFDVRKPEPLISSGSPFYLAIEAGILAAERFIEFGIQRHCNAKALWDYIESKKIETVPFERLRHGRAAGEFQKALAALAAKSDQVVVSFDLDAAAAAFAPGVSAPQAEGFTPSDVLEMMEISAREAKVCSLGIFELNPEHDQDGRTARLAAESAYHFAAERLAGA